MPRKRKQEVRDDRGYRTRNKALFSDTTIDRLLRDSTAKGSRIENGVEIVVYAVIEPEAWDRVNRRLGTKIQKQPVNLFARIVLCSCGGRMIVPGNSSKYVCTKCRHKIPTDDLEAVFHSQLKPLVISEECNLYESWPHLNVKDKRTIIENICEKITVARESIAVRFACDLSPLKTVTVVQRTEVPNETATDPTETVPAFTYAKEPLLSEKEAARFLGISYTTMLRKRNAGDIGFFRVGFRVLYSKEKHLIPFLQTCEK